MFTRWSATGGFREALSIGLPLVVSMASTTVMQFTDRIFLGHYSLESLAAAVPAGIVSFMFLSFFMGVTEYVNVFVAQYTGAGRPERVGVAMWQGLWFVLPAWAIMITIGVFAPGIFRLAGHPPEICSLEAIYFRIMCLGTGPGLTAVCLSNFYAGRGITKPVMMVNMLCATLNIPLDYAMINGYWGFPELGITGAALGTVISQTASVGMYILLVFRSENERCYRMRSAWRFDPELFRRFMRFGLPGGVQFFVDMFAVSFFVFMVARLGKIDLTATNIALSLNSLSFLPMIGMSIAASVMTGQAMGARNPGRADYSTGTVLRIALSYMALACVGFLVFPNELLTLFQPRDMTAADFEPVLRVGINLLRIVAAFVLIDAFAIIYMGALKGAGDTRFIMKTMLLSSTCTIVLPILIMERWFDLGVYGPWFCLFFYVLALATSFRLRFKRGAWRSMEVIERTPPVAP